MFQNNIDLCKLTLKLVTRTFYGVNAVLLHTFNSHFDILIVVEPVCSLDAIVVSRAKLWKFPTILSTFLLSGIPNSVKFCQKTHN